MIDKDAAYCGQCRQYERYLGQFSPLPDGTYICVPCVDMQRVERRLARQEAYQKKFNRPDVKHGQLRICVCGHKGRIDFDYMGQDLGSAFDNSIKQYDDGRWRCTFCPSQPKASGSAGAN